MADGSLRVVTPPKLAPNCRSTIPLDGVCLLQRIQAFGVVVVGGLTGLGLVKSCGGSSLVFTGAAARGYRRFPVALRGDLHGIKVDGQGLDRSLDLRG